MSNVERFPITIPLAVAYLYAALTIGLLQVEAIGKGLVQVQQELGFMFELLIGGPVILLVTSLAFTRSTQMLRPQRLIIRWDPQQALIVVVGLGLVSVWQLFINQLTITPFTAQLAPQSAFAFKTDAAIVEESFFGSLGVLFYTFLRFKGGFSRVTSIILASPIVAVLFMYFHNTDIAYAAVPQALVFVLGLRLIITPIQLYTHSIFSGIAIHWPWNAVSG